MVGKSISHYKILEKLGEGSMGVVYKAQDTKLDRFVALKFLPPYLSMDDEAKLRFVHEAKAASALDHANICTIYEISETEDGQTFIAMAYYDGETIKAKIARGPLPVSEALDYAVQAALGLSKAHAEGIIHRDIKPANIMVTRDGVVKIVDFGLAKMASQTQLTKAGTTLGTVSYMSPEQTQGEEVDARTDVWSLGVVLYELLTGKPPFRGDYEAAVIYSILHEAPEPISAVRPDVPEELAQVVLQCLDQDRDHRLESAEALIAALPGGTSPIIVTAGPPPSTAKTLAIFGVAAIIGSGVVYAAMMLLGLPDWVFPVGLVLLLAGFPLVLLSSMFEKRRAGMKTSERAELSGLQKWLTTRRVVHGGVLAMSSFGVVTAVFMILRALGIGAFATLLTAGILQEDDRIIVAEFENRTDQEDLGKTLTTAFKIDLSQSTSITVVERPTEVSLLTLMKRDPETTITLEVALDMAERQGAKAVVAGELGSVGAGFLLSVRLIAVEDGRTLVRLRETASDDKALLDAIDRLSDGLREEIGESLRSIRSSPPLEKVTTASLDALRSFGIGVDLQVLGKYREAELELSRTVELDSTFAMAWHDYAAVVLNQQQDHSRSVDLFTRAYELRARLTERERLHVTASYNFFANNNFEAVVSALQAVLDRHPYDWRALGNLGMTILDQRRYAAAEELFRRALQLVPSAAVYSSLVRALASQGHFEDMQAVMAEYSRNVPRAPDFLHGELMGAIAMEDYEHALSIADSMRSVLKVPFVRQEGLLALMAVHLARGQVRSARLYVEELVRYHLQLGDSLGASHAGLFGLVNELGTTADSVYIRGALDEHLRRFPVVSDDDSSYPFQTLAELHLDLGEIEAAESVVSKPDPGIFANWNFVPPFPPMNLARIVFMRDGPDEGIPAMVAAYDQLGCNRGGLDAIGLAYDEAGRYPEAIRFL